MKLREKLISKTSIIPYKDVAVFMGYNDHSAFKASNRIHNVLHSEKLGLDESGYDFKYSNLEFLDRLCEVLGVTDHAGEINEILSAISNEKTRFKNTMT